MTGARIFPKIVSKSYLAGEVVQGLFGVYVEFQEVLGVTLFARRRCVEIEIVMSNIKRRWKCRRAVVVPARKCYHRYAIA